MKKIIMMMLVLSATVLSEIKNTYSLIIGVYTQHIETNEIEADLDYNEKNNLIGLEINHGREHFGVAVFDNSFGDFSHMVEYRHDVFYSKYFKLQLGVSVVNGYKPMSYVDSKTKDMQYFVNFNNNKYYIDDLELLIVPMIGAEIDLSDHVGIKCDLFGTAIESSIKYTF